MGDFGHLVAKTQRLRMETIKNPLNVAIVIRSFQVI